MVVDYERAWIRLQALIASKSQHGREATLQRMAEIAEECQVPAGELSRLLRLYGVEVVRARAMSTDTRPMAVADSDGDSILVGTVSGAGHHRPEVGHDGSNNEGGRARAEF